MKLLLTLVWLMAFSAVIVPAELMTKTTGLDVPSRQARILKLKPSSLVEDVRRQLEKHPAMTAKEVTAYANSLLVKKGFNYGFATADFIRKHNVKPVGARDYIQTLRFSLEQPDGVKVTLQSRVEEGRCGEFFADIPALRVTRQEIVALLDGRIQRFRRPKEFDLDEMELLNEAMKQVIRKWEVPDQTYPLGISADGQTLYVPVNFSKADSEAVGQVLWKGEQPEKLRYPLSVLAISSSGIRFEVAAEVLRQQKSEEITSYPKDPNNDYLAFRKFRVGGKTYIIRYSSPCT
ncbi:MAG TPA: hypothetical protein VFD58_27615 [Blastocatellia bacterium]|nr:hypothetical protein [Blastocatellia bacterium]